MNRSSLRPAFQNSTSSPGSERAHKRPAPFSIRFTMEERARLKREAGDLALSAYIRMKLFGDDASPRKPHTARKRREPTVDRAALSQALGTLGQTRIAPNLNQIARAANVGALPVTPALEQELQEACAAIRGMRSALMSAIGLKAQAPRINAASHTESDA